MSKQLKITEERKQIRINGNKLNSYLLYRNLGLSPTVFDTVTDSPNKEEMTYVSQEHKLLPNGYVQELVQKDYPINSKSVSSLAEGADYRNDPVQAIARAPQRVNLGDITEAQKFLENPMHNAKILDIVKEKVAEYYNTVFKQQQQRQEPQLDVSEGGDDNGK